MTSTEASSSVATAIKLILIEEGRVAVPALGTLVREQKPASLDGADRTIRPPSSTIRFNGNLTASDGRLVTKLMDLEALSQRDAERAIVGFVSDIKGRMTDDRGFEIEGVGRLYRQFDGRVNFTSVKEGVNKEHYGLPAVTFYPIQRPRIPEKEDVITVAPVKRVKPPRRAATEGEIPTGVWITLGLLLLATLAGAGYFLLGTSKAEPVRPTRQTDARSATQPKTVTPPGAANDRVGTPNANGPSVVPASAIAPEPPPTIRRYVPNPNAPFDPTVGARERYIVIEEPVAPIRDERSALDASSPNAPRTVASDNTAVYPQTVESPIIAPATGRSAPVTPRETTPARDGSGRVQMIIVIGAFRDNQGADEKLAAIRAAGYTPYSKRMEEFTRLGVVTSYATGVERNQILKEVRERIAPEAFIMFEDGRWSGGDGN